MTAIKWDASIATPRGVSAMLLDPPTGDVTWHWGDDTSDQVTGDVMNHVYPVAGTYTILATLGDTVIAAATVVVLPDLAPAHEVTSNPEWGKERKTTITFPATVDRVGSPGRIIWPTSGWPDQTEDIDIRPGASYTRYLNTGDDQPYVLVDDGSRRVYSGTLDVPETIYDPDFTWRYLPATVDPDGKTVEFEITRVQDSPIRLCFEWGGPCDAQSWGSIVIDTPKVGDTVRYTYDDIQIEQGAGIARATYITDDQRHGQNVAIELPRPADR